VARLDSSYASSTSSVVTINVGATQVTLKTSTTTSVVNQKVTFTTALKSGATPLTGKPVTIYNYLNGVCYDHTNKTADSKGQIIFTQTFGSTGQLTYYATFAGDSTYGASSGTVTVNVKAR
jgi:hypothetical protein